MVECRDVLLGWMSPARWPAGVELAGWDTAERLTGPTDPMLRVLGYTSRSTSPARHRVRAPGLLLLPVR